MIYSGDLEVLSKLGCYFQQVQIISFQQYL